MLHAHASCSCSCLCVDVTQIFAFVCVGVCVCVCVCVGLCAFECCVCVCRIVLRLCVLCVCVCVCVCGFVCVLCVVYLCVSHRFAFVCIVPIVRTYRNVKYTSCSYLCVLWPLPAGERAGQRWCRRPRIRGGPAAGATNAGSTLLPLLVQFSILPSRFRCFWVAGRLQ